MYDRKPIISPKLRAVRGVDLHAIHGDPYKGQWPVEPGVLLRELPTAESIFAMRLIEKLAPVAEGSGVMPTNVVVPLACEYAEQAFAAFRERGWMIEVPSMEELTAALKAAHEAPDAPTAAGEGNDGSGGSPSSTGPDS
jgi:hypothetical protein